MKKFLSLLMVLGFAFSANANLSSEGLPDSLKTTMKAMGTRMKAVAAQMNNPAQNENSALVLEEVSTLALHAKTFIPAVIEEMADEQKANATIEYNQQLDNVANLALQASAAFRANDNATAVAIMSQLNQAKRDGHDQFDP